VNTKNLAVAVAAVLSSSILQPAYQAQELEEEGNGEVIEQIIVTSTRVRRSFAEQPTRVEVLGGEEINEKVNMKPGEIRMLLAESTGIQVQQTSATSFNSSIRIQGLDGRYTQLLKDSMPLYGGFSGGLSLLQIAPLDLQRVEVIKGASSTLYGGGAIAGLVNLITKRPGADPEALLLLNATSAGGQDVSAYLSGQSGDVGATLYSAYNRSDAYDPADNGLSAIPEFERWTFNPRIFVEGERSEFTAGINLSVEDRLGGDMDLINGRSPESAYFESSDTERATSQLEYIYSYPSGNELVLRNSINYFTRDLQIPGFQFSGTQLSSFSEAHIVGTTTLMDWVAGINLWTEDFDQDFAAPGFEQDFNNQTIGGFVQGTVPLSERWIVEAGLRLDSTSDYGNFILPRVSLLYKPDAVTNIRIGGGLGYEEPNLFTEDAERRQFQSIRPLQTSSLRAEESTGINVDINRSFEFGSSTSLDLNFLMFYTRVDQPLRLLEHSPGVFGFQQPVEYLDTRGSELNAVLRWQDFKLFLGLTHTDVEEHDTSGVRDYLLVPENRVNSVLVYELEDNLRIGLEAYYYGHQVLSDGTKSRDYWVTGLMMEKTFGEDNSFFLNFENFTDARLTRYGDLYTGPITNPVFNDIYAPLDGFVINGGIKIRI
jgi:iron complex outermembrane receptor protein